MRKRYKEALQEAGVRAVRFHDLRHTFGTHCAAEGVPMRMLQEWTGHRDIKTTQIYADYAPSAHEAELMESAFSRVDKGTEGGQATPSDRQGSELGDPAGLADYRPD